MSHELRWTEQAVNQLGGIAEYVGLASPIYAEQLVERVVGRLRQAQEFPLSGRQVPEAGQANLRELVEVPYRVIYQVLPAAIVVIAVVHGRQDLRTHLSG